jgi:hypothetical protein
MLKRTQEKEPRILTEREFAILKLAMNEISVSDLFVALSERNLNMLVNTLHHIVGRLESEGLLEGRIERVEIEGRKRPRLHIRTTGIGIACIRETERAFAPTRFAPSGLMAEPLACR